MWRQCLYGAECHSHLNKNKNYCKKCRSVLVRPLAYNYRCKTKLTFPRRTLQFAFNFLNKICHFVIERSILREVDVHRGSYNHAQPAVWFETSFNNQRDDRPAMGVCILPFCFETEKNSLQKVVTTCETLVSFKRRLKHISFVYQIS